MNTTKLHDHLLRHLLKRHHHLEAKRQRQTRRQRRRTSHAHFLQMATIPPGDRKRERPLGKWFPGIHPRPTSLKACLILVPGGFGILPGRAI